MASGLLDLEVLVLRCRDARSRDYVREAVACYGAGAYRACVVATWIAVVFDVLGKLRELDLTGDPRAHAKLKEFEEIRAGGEGKLKEASEFERGILLKAQEFELLTPLEVTDLKRLQEDRHRCAHPSMQSFDDAYQPTAELARTHLRNAVEILLQREPVQGRAAQTRIFGDIKSTYFPSDIAQARTYLETGPLRRARDALVRDLVVGLTKAYLNDEALPDPERRRMIAGLGAIVEMHRAASETVLRTKVPEVMLSVPDDRFWAVLGYFRGVAEAWDLSNEAVRGRARAFLAVPQDGTQLLARAVGQAVHVPALEQDALRRLAGVGSSDFAMLVEQGPSPYYVPRAIQEFGTPRSFKNAESLFESLVLPLAGVLTSTQLREVLKAIQMDGRIWSADKSPALVLRLLVATEKLRADTMADWQKLASFLVVNKPQYKSLLETMTTIGMWQACLRPENS